MNNLKIQIENRIKRKKAELEKLKNEINECNIGYQNLDKFLKFSEKKTRLEAIIETLEEVICDVQLKIEENN